jgi:hypothetical protein
LRIWTAVYPILRFVDRGARCFDTHKQAPSEFLRRYVGGVEPIAGMGIAKQNYAARTVEVTIRTVRVRNRRVAE